MSIKNIANDKSPFTIGSSNSEFSEITYAKNSYAVSAGNTSAAAVTITTNCGIVEILNVVGIGEGDNLTVTVTYDGYNPISQLVFCQNVAIGSNAGDQIRMHATVQDANTGTFDVVLRNNSSDASASPTYYFSYLIV